MFWSSVIEAELTFLEKEEEMFARNAVVFAQDTLGLVPEVFDAVNVMAALVDEGLRMIDATMLEAGDVENVITRKTIGIDHGIR